jgi:tRNA (guanine37-N1)-methyltransferase
MVDDTPYGGGTGMLLKVDVMDAAIEAVKDSKLNKQEQQVILLDPRGKTFVQTKAQEFANLKHLILICGHYEGYDERIRTLVDQTISIGDFITTGGEIPAILITDAVGRLVSGVLKDDATLHESFSIAHEEEGKLLEYPQYTMPNEYKGMKVPEVLLSGNHPEIAKWRSEEAHKLTLKHRPDLLK